MVASPSRCGSGSRFLVSAMAHVPVDDFACFAPIWVAGDFLGISGLSGAVQSGEQAAMNCSSYKESKCQEWN